MAFRNNSKVFPYIVVLKQKHKRSGELITILSAFIFILILLAKLFTNASDWAFITLTIVCITGLMSYNIFQFVKKKKVEMMLLLLTALLSFFFLSFFAQLAFVLLAISGYMATRSEEIGFSDEEIVFKSVFSKHIKWAELENVLIKDGILTLDYKNNKLFQAETDDDEENEDYDVGEEEFNAYCREQLNKCGK